MKKTLANRKTLFLLSFLAAFNSYCGATPLGDFVAAHAQTLPRATVTYNGNSLECYLVGEKERFALLLVPREENHDFDILRLSCLGNGCFSFNRDRANSVRAYNIIAPPLLGHKKQIRDYKLEGEDDDTLILPVGSVVLDYASALDAEARFRWVPAADKAALARMGYSEEEMKNFLSGLHPTSRSDRGGSTQQYYVARVAGVDGANLAVWVVSGYVGQRGDVVSRSKSLPDGVYLIDSRTGTLKPAQEKLPSVCFWEDLPEIASREYPNYALNYGQNRLVFGWPATEYTDVATGREFYALDGGLLTQEKSAFKSLEDTMHGSVSNDKNEHDAKRRRTNLIGLAGSGGVALGAYALLCKKAARLKEVEALLQEFDERGEEAPAALLDEATSLRRWRGGLRLATGGSAILTLFFLAQLVTGKADKMPKELAGK